MTYIKLTGGGQKKVAIHLKWHALTFFDKTELYVHLIKSLFKYVLHYIVYMWIYIETFFYILKGWTYFRNIYRPSWKWLIFKKNPPSLFTICVASAFTFHGLPRYELNKPQGSLQIQLKTPLSDVHEKTIIFNFYMLIWGTFSSDWSIQEWERNLFIIFPLYGPSQA